MRNLVLQLILYLETVPVYHQLFELIRNFQALAIQSKLLIKGNRGLTKNIHWGCNNKQ